MALLTVDDLTPFAQIEDAKAIAMIADAEAMAVLAAPCIADPEFQANETLVAAAKAIVRGAILRWNDAGSGAVTQQTVGPFAQTVDTSKTRRGMFWPSEIDQLRDLCSRFNGDESRGSAFSIVPGASGSVQHAPWCSLMFGATYCSCGASLTGDYPLWEMT